MGNLALAYPQHCFLVSLGLQAAVPRVSENWANRKAKAPASTLTLHAGNSVCRKLDLGVARERWESFLPLP